MEPAGSDGHDNSHDISARKLDHLQLATRPEANFAKVTTMLEEVMFAHQSLPELARSELSLDTEFLGHTLAAPLCITGMTGGADAATAINADLASLAEEYQILFGVGSQRAMAENPALTSSYNVRATAPHAFVLGNLGVMQLQSLGIARAQQLLASIGANALAVHLNPAQEMAQDEGDRDFRGAIATLQQAVNELKMPIVVKETGAGMSWQTLQSLRELNVNAVDVSGAGGTSWVAVEALRSKTADARVVGKELHDWGIPTAVSTVMARAAGHHTIIASGGIRTGLDVARALALGATVVGVAAPVLAAYQNGGIASARAYLADVLASLRSIMMLTGSKSTAALAVAPRWIKPNLRDACEQLSGQTSEQLFGAKRSSREP